MQVCRASMLHIPASSCSACAVPVREAPWLLQALPQHFHSCTHASVLLGRLQQAPGGTIKLQRGHSTSHGHLAHGVHEQHMGMAALIRVLLVAALPRFYD